MPISIVDMFSIGLGPSSSHTVGPMRAAHHFIDKLRDTAMLASTSRILVELFGSLAHTGIGHGTDNAIKLGLSGELPDSCEPDSSKSILDNIKNNQQLRISKGHVISFVEAKDIKFYKRKTLPHHSNAMRFSAYDQRNNLLYNNSYYSVGGGFVLEESDFSTASKTKDDTVIPYPFASASELLELCKTHGFSISTLLLENESAWRPKDETMDYLIKVWQTMEDCIHRGCETEGILPGGLNVRRRAAHLFRRLKSDTSSNDPCKVMDWVNLYALAVNEENAAGGRVVTAPTNGAAGIIPAVLSYVKHYKSNFDDQAIIRYLLTGDTGDDCTPAAINDDIADCYRATAEAMDTYIGELIAQIPAEIIANTMIIFIGDNGTPQEVVINEAGYPFIAEHAKGTVYEGGINVPLIIWAGENVGLGSGEVSDNTQISDLFSTVLELAGSTPNSGVTIDSKSLIGYLDIQTTTPENRSYLYSELYSNNQGIDRWAITDGEIKYLNNETVEECYNLTTDPGESSNAYSTGDSITSICNTLKGNRPQ